MSVNTQHCVVTRIFRQHTSLLTTVPYVIRQALNLRRGDYIMWAVDTRNQRLTVSRVETKEVVENGIATDSG